MIGAVRFYVYQETKPSQEPQGEAPDRGAHIAIFY